MDKSFLEYENAKDWKGKGIVPASGVYAIFLKEVEGVPEEWRERLHHKDHLLYIGMSKNLGKRLRKHFCGDSSRDTFRKSIGAILRHGLNLWLLLKTGDDLGRWRFDKESESDLSQWLQSHCQLNFIGRDENELEEFEKELIEDYIPLLNLDYNPHQSLKDIIKAERKECREMACYMRMKKELS